MTKRKKSHSKIAKNIVKSARENKESSASSIAELAYNKTQEIISQNDEIDIPESDNTEKISEIDKIKLLTSVANELPENSTDEFISNIFENDSTQAGVEVAKTTVQSLKDDTLIDIISNPEVTNRDSKYLLSKIDNDNIRKFLQEDLCIDELSKIYDNCTEMKENEITNAISRALNLVEKKPDGTDNYIKKIISKRIAKNYHDVGATLPSHFYEFMGPLKMLEIDLPELIDQEYTKMYSNENTSQSENDTSKKYNKQDFKMTLIESLGHIIGYKHKRGKTQILIPHSDIIQNFTQEEEDAFVEAIISSSGDSLRNQEIQKIRNQIHGSPDTDEVLDLINNLNSIPDITTQNYTAKSFSDILFSISKLETDQQKKVLDTLVKTTSKAVKKSSKDNPSLDTSNNVSNKADKDSNSRE